MAWNFLSSLLGKRRRPTPPASTVALVSARTSPRQGAPLVVSAPVEAQAAPAPASPAKPTPATPAVAESAAKLATPSAPGVSVPSLRVTPADGQRSRARVISLDTPPIGESALAYSGELRDRLNGALRTLDAALDDKQRVGDAGAFLRELSGDPTAAIRQLPMAAQRALGLVNQEATNAQLTEYFERDPAITQALLQQANGLYYNPNGRRVLAVNEAINRLGRSGVKNVLLHQAVQGLVCRPGGEYDAMVNKAWLHMVRTAQVARAIAPAFGVDREQAFALALLHDAGKLVVFDRLAALRTRLRRAPIMERSVVRRALKLVHEPMGGLAVLAWSLGLDAARAVATHHREPVPAMQDTLCEVLFVAERIDIARQKGMAFDAETAWKVGQLSGEMDETIRRADAERRQEAA